MDVKITIDPNEVFDDMTGTEEKSFIDDNIDKASDSRLVDEILSRGLVNDVINALDSTRLEELRNDYFTD